MAYVQRALMMYRSDLIRHRPLRYLAAIKRSAERAANLNGTLPVIGTGQWSFAVGGNPDGLGVISDINSRTSLLTGTAGKSYILRWTISNGTCPSSASNVTINFQQTPTVSNAGVNQNFCGTTVTLGANRSIDRHGRMELCTGGNPDGLPLTAFQ